MFLGYVHIYIHVFYTACKLLLGFWLVGLFKWSLRWLRLVIGWNLRHILGLEHAHDSAWRFEITSKRSFYDAKMTTQWISSTFERILGVAVWFALVFPQQMIPPKKNPTDSLIYIDLLWSPRNSYKNQLAKFLLDNELASIAYHWQHGKSCRFTIFIIREFFLWKKQTRRFFDRFWYISFIRKVKEWMDFPHVYPRQSPDLISPKRHLVSPPGHAAAARSPSPPISPCSGCLTTRKWWKWNWPNIGKIIWKWWVPVN